jgi:soluble lytic murein transglycosylase-like protein
VKIEDFPAVREIYSRIQEISKISDQFEHLGNFKLSEISKESSFLSEYKKSIQESQSEATSKNPAVEPEDENQLSQKILSQPKPKSQSVKKKGGIFDIIQKEAKSKGVDPDLVKAIIKAESNFNPKAESHKGAMGLMQLMPSTAEELGVDDPFNPVENIQGGVTYLKELSRLFSKRDHVIAAYNAGPGAVKKFGGVPPYSETQNYVKKVKEYFQNYKK